MNKHAMAPGSLLQRLLQIDSPSGSERAVAEFLRDHAQLLGLASTIDGAGNFVAATSGDPLRSTPGVHDIVLLGHMDVVPGVVPIRVEGDLLFGRGAVDAKGPLAAFLLAAARAKDTLSANTRLVVIGAVEEEVVTSKGARAVVPRYQPAACIVGEPSRWDSVTIGYKGRLLVTYDSQQAVAHTAGPQLSVGDRFARWWQDVLDLVTSINERRTSPFQLLQATIRSVHAESDGLVDRCTAVAAFRLPSDVHPSRVSERCQRHAFDAQLTFSGAESAIVTSRTSPLARALTTSIRAHGGQPAFVLKTGTSDMNVVGAPGAWSCPIVAYGPGDSSLDHTPNEHISITEFLKSIDVLRHALGSFASETSGPTSPREGVGGWAQ